MCVPWVVHEQGESVDDVGSRGGGEAAGAAAGGAAAVEEGRLHLTAVVRLAPHFTAENVEALIAEASGKRKAELEIMLARLAPKADLPARLERVGGQEVPVPEPPDVDVVGKRSRPAAGVGRVVALAPGRFALQVTIGEGTQRKLLRAQALLRHQVPSGDLAEVLDVALDALLDRMEKTKFGRTRKARPAKACSGRRTVPREVRRQAVARDGMRCAFVSVDGRRCEETGFLELDHVVPVARGGRGTAENVRVLCRAHNQYEAERILGRETLQAGRAAGARRRPRLRSPPHGRDGRGRAPGGGVGSEDRNHRGADAGGAPGTAFPVRGPAGGAAGRGDVEPAIAVRWAARMGRCGRSW